MAGATTTGREGTVGGIRGRNGQGSRLLGVGTATGPVVVIKGGGIMITAGGDDD